MISLNSDYRNIESQIKDLEFLSTNIDDEVFDFFIKNALLDTFYYLYTALTGIKLKREPNAYAEQMDYLYLELIDQYKISFLNNKKYHRKVFLNALRNNGRMKNLFQQFNISDEESLPENDSNLDAEKVIFSFLEEKFSSAIPVLENLIKNRRIFLFSDIDYYYETFGATSYNFVQNIGNVFIQRELQDINILTTFAHELGHVYDFVECGQRFSTKGQFNLSQGTFSEVISTYFEQAFLEFLISNNIRKEEALYNLAAYLNEAYLDLQKSLFLTSISDDNYQKLIYEILKSSEIKLEREFSYDIPPLESLSGRLEIDYAYGLLLTNMMSNGNLSLEDFLRIRASTFSPEQLENIGFNPNRASKSLTKTLKKYF